LESVRCRGTLDVTDAVEEGPFVADPEPQRGGQLDRERLEALRGDVTAHVSALSHREREDLLRLIDATLDRIDAELERLDDAGTAQPPA
jgi:hypothetical protein